MNNHSSSESSNSNIETDEEQEEYEVEKILDHRWIKGKVQYLLKWKDLNESENSWEDEENLSCGNLVLEYIKKKFSFLTLIDQENFKPIPNGSNIKFIDSKIYFNRVLYFVEIKLTGEKGILTSQEAKDKYPIELLEYLEKIVEIQKI